MTKNKNKMKYSVLPKDCNIKNFTDKFIFLKYQLYPKPGNYL